MVRLYLSSKWRGVMSIENAGLFALEVTLYMNLNGGSRD
jgi:hypothetical protein